jgi:hypothetical protein
MVDVTQNAGKITGTSLFNSYDMTQDTSKFPLNLLSAGYGTALLGALFLYHLDGDIVTSGLTLWLGGVVAVFFWGGIWIHFDKKFLPSLRTSP